MLGENWSLVADFIDKYETIVLIVCAVAVVVFVVNRLLKLRKQKANLTRRSMPPVDYRKTDCRI